MTNNCRRQFNFKMKKKLKSERTVRTNSSPNGDDGIPTVMTRSANNKNKNSTEIEKKSIRNVIKCFVILLASEQILAPDRANLVEGLQITNFRVPAFVPNSLPTASSSGAGGSQTNDLTKPILFDCDYDYKPDEDERLTVKWFKNKEAEPFYQWLPELNVRYFADWMRPLVNQSFVSDPHDPMKRFRSLLIRRLSMNLTGQYTCLVSSLAGQDMRQSSLVIYQPPRTFTFEHKIYPAPALLAPPSSFNSWPPASGRPPPPSPLATPDYNQPAGGLPLQLLQASPSSDVPPPPTTQFINPTSGSSPTQFRGLTGPPTAPNKLSNWQQQTVITSHHHPASGSIIRPPNNNNNQTYHHLSSLQLQQQQQSGEQPALQSANNINSTRIVYTHDGRPIRRKSKRQTSPSSSGPPISAWQLKKKLNLNGQQTDQQQQRQPTYAIQLHHFQCQATQVTPRPVLVLTVKRDLDSIAQYLHESSSLVVRPYQVSQAELFNNNNGQQQRAATHSNSSDLSASSDLSPMLVTLYDISVSATVALNVSLPPPSSSSVADRAGQPATLGSSAVEPVGLRQQHQPPLDPSPLVAAEQQKLAAGANIPVMMQHHQAAGLNTVLQYRRGQRMSFECHLELTGTEFEQRKRIQINEEEVFKSAEAEEMRKRRLQIQQDQFEQQLVQQFQWRQHQANGIRTTNGDPEDSANPINAEQSNGLFSLVGFSSSSAASSPPIASLDFISNPNAEKQLVALGCLLVSLLFIGNL